MEVRYMWRLSIILLIGINIFAFGDVYEPPTDAQLLAWWQRLTPIEQLAELRKLDNIEHAIPTVSPLDIVPILMDNGDLVLSIQSPVNVKIDYLEYDIHLSDMIVQGFYKTGSTLPEILTWAGLGTLTGVIITMIFRG
jgi:hypothetical protein